MKNLDLIQKQSFTYAVAIVKLYKELNTENSETILSEQMMLAATTLGANVRMAAGEEIHSSDYLHSLKEARKDCDESIYWLELLHHADYLSKEVFTALAAQGNDILSALKDIVLQSEQGDLI